MVGIILASHGEMANGVLKTVKLFFGELEQIKAVCLDGSESTEMYLQRLKSAINEVDQGDGVIIFCDLLFGTPCNCSARLIREDIEILTGLNLPLILETLGTRSQGNINIDSLIETGRSGIIDLKTKLASNNDINDDFL